MAGERRFRLSPLVPRDFSRDFRRSRGGGEGGQISRDLVHGDGPPGGAREGSTGHVSVDVIVTVIVTCSASLFLFPFLVPFFLRLLPVPSTPPLAACLSLSLSLVTCLLSPVPCHSSLVHCPLSPVPCHLSPVPNPAPLPFVTCHLSHYLSLIRVPCPFSPVLVPCCVRCPCPLSRPLSLIPVPIPCPTPCPHLMSLSLIPAPVALSQ